MSDLKPGKQCINCFCAKITDITNGKLKVYIKYDHSSNEFICIHTYTIDVLIKKNKISIGDYVLVKKLCNETLSYIVIDKVVL